MVLSPFGGLFQPCWSRSDGVVPFRMECVALDVERLHLGLADFDTPFVGGGVERAFDLQADLGGGRGNQLDPPPDVPIKIQDHSRRHSPYSAILLSTSGSKRWISMVMADN